jgi:phosphoglycerate dehydrogenase-like enzyme
LGCETTIVAEQTFQDDRHALHEADILIASGSVRVTREHLVSAPRLRAVVSCITGTDGFDEQAATELGIAIVNAPIPQTYESMAEATIMLVLVCLYSLHKSESILRNQLARPPAVHARMLKGKTVGIIGFGDIGRAIVARLTGWGATISIYSAHAQASLPEGVNQIGLDELLRKSDVVVVVTSLNAATRDLLTAERLGLMKRGAVLVNTARGGIVDESGLYELARSGHLSMIALDVFAREPLPADSPLRELSNAILTPHMVGHTEDIALGLPGAGIENAAAVLAGRAPQYLKNRTVLPTWRERWGGVSLLAGTAMQSVET